MSLLRGAACAAPQGDTEAREDVAARGLAPTSSLAKLRRPDLQGKGEAAQAPEASRRLPRLRPCSRPRRAAASAPTWPRRLPPTPPPTRPVGRDQRRGAREPGAPRLRQRVGGARGVAAREFNNLQTYKECGEEAIRPTSRSSTGRRSASRCASAGSTSCRRCSRPTAGCRARSTWARRARCCRRSSTAGDPAIFKAGPGSAARCSRAATSRQDIFESPRVARTAARRRTGPTSTRSATTSSSTTPRSSSASGTCR